jgi:hypothetical protein
MKIYTVMLNYDCVVYVFAKSNRGIRAMCIRGERDEKKEGKKGPIEL